MARFQCTVRIIAGQTHGRRSVVLLDYPVPYVNALDVFVGLDQSGDRYYRKSFDMWVDNHNRPGRYHGWNKSEHGGKYTECYVFKRVEEAERFYGFLTHVKDDKPSHETCVLVLAAEKKKWTTDTTELDRANEMRTNAHVLAALRDPKLFTEGEVIYTWLT